VNHGAENGLLQVERSANQSIRHGSTGRYLPDLEPRNRSSPRQTEHGWRPLPHTIEHLHASLLRSTPDPHANPRSDAAWTHHQRSIKRPPPNENPQISAPGAPNSPNRPRPNQRESQRKPPAEPEPGGGRVDPRAIGRIWNETARAAQGGGGRRLGGGGDGGGWG
jgi:hypothetical protein